MKINSTILEALKEDGLHIVDCDGIPYETEEENDLIHQQMADKHINHAEELSIDKWLREEKLALESEAAMGFYI